MTKQTTVIVAIFRSLNVLTNGRFSVPTKDEFLIFGPIPIKKLRSMKPRIFVWSILLMEAVYIIYTGC
jgi:hypothetical protein